MAGRKVIDEICHVSARRGNGQLRREVWVDQAGRVVRYNLAYINHAIHPGDNGRVVGYDNAHDGHHRHYLGTVQPVSFESYEDIERRFERDWLALRNKT